MIKAVIFDIDGVLIDSLEANLKFFRQVLKIGGYSMLPTKKLYKSLFHLPIAQSFKVFANTQDTKEIKRLMKLVDDNTHLRTPFDITLNSRKVLALLAKKYPLALVTARIESGLNHYFQVAKTRHLFKVHVHHGHYKNAKPHPEPLLIACKRLKVKPVQAVYIGDARTDIEAAKAAGMKVILFPKRRIPGADAYAKAFTEIPKLIRLLDANILNKK